MDLTQLSQTIKARRRALKLTQEQLADLAGCSTSFVHLVESGKPTVRLDKLADLLEVLGLQLVVVERSIT